MNLVAEEDKNFKDILLWDFQESHANLSLKERCFLEWLNHQCKEVEFIFKGDDDEFVNPEALVRYVMETANASHDLHGNLQRDALAFRGGKYKITETLYPFRTYPDFLSGGGFIMPRESIPALYLASKQLPVFPFDDVYLGFLGLAANITYHHDDRFYVFGLIGSFCQYKNALVVHGIPPERLIEIWGHVQESQCQ
ncbi:UDP-GlcNAc:betaGal beta-1,3-N-acetylglucosaminyltransferase 7-like [Rhinatrema bivittatum]|uniref:UDP-GlcNAc:betaGal beta-1,3-N-acetylglucosaminyltransferase 7-like n=1 Tax=Rhinatrema bivittatum TaxID=194408 RepID=UPI001129EBAD|nr:UDP-GlcNAc:betaGal beta-1,3-N-acetylglucosaminyltransferase 7-like [Rhinatrema bivittatum]